MKKKKKKKMAGKVAGAHRQDDVPAVSAADRMRISDIWNLLVSDAVSGSVLCESGEKRMY